MNKFTAIEQIRVYLNSVVNDLIFPVFQQMSFNVRSLVLTIVFADKAQTGIQ